MKLLECAGYNPILINAIILSSLLAGNVTSDRNVSEETCVFIDHIGKDEVDVANIKCSQSSVCKKTFKISNIRLPPYNFASEENQRRGLENILKKCCGSCVRTDIVNNFENVSQVTPESLKSSDFVYPFLAASSTVKLHGFYFLPYEDASKALYITKTTRPKLLSNIFDLYPLIIVCLLLAVISGFIAWLMETWSNPEEFPRPFLIGWFEGFWWSFISMTTVGYGDKTPKSIPGRLFSVIWILIGIIACGLITGELTGQVIKANHPPPASMRGKYIGVLQYRYYDAYVVAQHGGVIVTNKKVTDFKSDVLQLITKLQRELIDGFLLDRETLLFVTQELIATDEDTDDPEVKKKIRFFMEETTRVDKTYEGEKFTYGLLVKHSEDYEYFKDYVIYNRQKSIILSEIEWSVFLEDAKVDHYGKVYSFSSVLFSSEGEYFKKSMISIAVMIGAILLFGLFYELRRKLSKVKTTGQNRIA